MKLRQKRMIALYIDLAIIVAIDVIASFIIEMFTGKIINENYFLMFLGFFLFKDIIGIKRSFGKKIMKVKMLRDNKKIGFSMILLRSILGTILFIIDIPIWWVSNSRLTDNLLKIRVECEWQTDESFT